MYSETAIGLRSPLKPTLSILVAITLLNSGPMVASLGDGNTLYLSFVSDAPKKRAWRPDGTLTPPFISNDRLGEFEGVLPQLKSGDLGVLLTLKLKQSPADLASTHGGKYLWQPTFPQIDPPTGVDYGILSAAVKAGKNTFFCGRTIRKPGSGGEFSLKVKVADTAWSTVVEATFRKEAKTHGGDFISEPAFPTGLSHTAGKAFAIKIPAKWKNSDVRLIAYDASGDFHPSGGEFRSTAGKKYMWFTCPSKDVVRVDLQARPFKTVEFKGIQPQPKGWSPTQNAKGVFP